MASAHVPALRASSARSNSAIGTLTLCAPVRSPIAIASLYSSRARATFSRPSWIEAVPRTIAMRFGSSGAIVLAAIA